MRTSVRAGVQEPDLLAARASVMMRSSRRVTQRESIIDDEEGTEGLSFAEATTNLVIACVGVSVCCFPRVIHYLLLKFSRYC